MGDLKSLLQRKTEIEYHIKNLQTSLAETMDEIEGVVSLPVENQRKHLGKDTGVITLNFGSVTVKHDLPKKVEWDQVILKDIFTKIKNADDDPENYMSIKYSVPEKKYTSFSSQMQEVFIPARTMKTGKAKLTFQIGE